MDGPDSGPVFIELCLIMFDLRCHIQPAQPTRGLRSHARPVPVRALREMLYYSNDMEGLNDFAQRTDPPGIEPGSLGSKPKRMSSTL